MRPGLEQHVGAVREAAVRRLVVALPFNMELLVDRIGPAPAEERLQLSVVLVAALAAGAMPGGECGRLVEEEELREAAGLEQRVPAAALELEPAGDPALDRVGPADAAGVVVQAAAVAVDEAARRIRDQLAKGGDTVSERHLLARQERRNSYPGVRRIGARPGGWTGAGRGTSGGIGRTADRPETTSTFSPWWLTSRRSPASSV